MIIFPPAKINLGLNVLRKREDGYHDISTCMVPVPLHDILELIPDRSEELVLSGIEVHGDIRENLCWRAYELIRSEFDIPETYIHLIKQIPMGAGLGGGSSDATSVLLGLNQIYSLGLTDQQLSEHAARLGSDCPFFVRSEAQMATGRGEVLQPVDVRLDGYYLKLINPGIHVGTAQAYSGVVLNENHPLINEIVTQSPDTWKGKLFNSFEEHIFRAHPELNRIKEYLYTEGAVYAAMSGSGSTLFGIFKERPQPTYSNYYEKIVKFNP